MYESEFILKQVVVPFDMKSFLFVEDVIPVDMDSFIFSETIGIDTVLTSFSFVEKIEQQFNAKIIKRVRS